MSVIWVTIAIALVVIWAITVVDIIRRPLSGGQTAAWLLIVLIVPFIGAIVYWALRKPPADELARTEAAARSLREDSRHRGFDSTRPGR